MIRYSIRADMLWYDSIDLTKSSPFYEIDIPLIFQCQKSSFTILSKGLLSVGVF